MQLNAYLISENQSKQNPLLPPFFLKGSPGLLLAPLGSADCSTQQIRTKMDVVSTSRVSTREAANVLIGVTGSVASIKLPKLVDELLLLDPKVQ